MPITITNEMVEEQVKKLREEIEENWQQIITHANNHNRFLLERSIGNLLPKEISILRWLGLRIIPEWEREPEEA